MGVLIKKFGFLGIALIFHFPVLYVIHIISCYFQDDRFRWHDASAFAWDAHFGKLNWSIWVIWALVLGNAPEGSILMIIGLTIWGICFIISLTPVHRYFV